MALIEVLVGELRDMYSAENQLVKALPKMAKGANDETLSSLFTMLLEETKGQGNRGMRGMRDSLIRVVYLRWREIARIRLSPFPP
jgi:hypothetical protein